VVQPGRQAASVRRTLYRLTLSVSELTLFLPLVLMATHISFGQSVDSLGKAGGPAQGLRRTNARLDFQASAEHRLADLNRVAACDLWH
jgi:hypothetical protein